MFEVNWNELLTPDLSTLEVVLRGSVMYLGIFALVRFVLKREAGAIGMADLLVTVLIADAAQNAMAIDYKSLPTGLMLVSTIVLWSAGLDWLAFHVPRFERIVHPRPLPLVLDGELQRHAMRRELVTYEELMSALREHGIEDVRDVKWAAVEGNGRLSAIARESRS